MDGKRTKWKTEEMEAVLEFAMGNHAKYLVCIGFIQLSLKAGYRSLIAVGLNAERQCRL